LFGSIAVSNGFAFSFSSIAGVIYVVEHTSSLNPAAWMELERRFGSGGLEWVFDPAAMTERRFYRVRALFAPEPQLTSPEWKGSGMEFKLNTTPGARYVVEYKDDLNDPMWVELSRHDAVGGPLAISDPGPHGTSRFYRVRVE
jgi:hypothetical protein